VRLEKDVPAAESVELELDPVPGSPGLYGGSCFAADEGSYVVRARRGDQPVANTARFEVENVPLEQRETAMRDDLAERIAALSGGKRLQPNELADLPELLKTDEQQSVTIHKEKDLWDMPVLFVLLVVISGTEWYIRRRENLV